MKKIQFYGYPKCSTCVKAKKALMAHQIPFEEYNIKETAPDSGIIKKVVNRGIAIKSLLNTSGLVYRELNIKESLKSMSLDEIADLLSRNGMLVKRPLVFDGTRVTAGFNEKDFLAVWTAQRS